MSVEITGEQRVGRWFLDFSKGYPRDVTRFAQAEMFTVLALAKKYAPVRTGRLVNAGFLDVEESGGGTFAVVAGFATHYAASVHKLHRTKARFLARAFEERQPGMVDRIAKRAFQAQRGAR